ncbi:response regulator [Paenibacillus sp. FSL R10-2734]|uniref:response regulator transcription factor n=1 Tax=Paenibacillus sp. FSL R10-2734 TaxID=2954691 RepID=UPI0030D7EFFD
MWNILLVEDEPFVRRSVRQSIPWEQLGFQVIAEAEDGYEAWDYMQAQPIDLVISDIVMPFMDGVALLKQAKEHGHSAHFIMLTCLNEFEMARQAIQHGAVGYILKLSMEREELESNLFKVRKLLSEKRRQHLLYLLTVYYKDLWSQLLGKREEAEQHLDEEIVAQIPAYVRIYARPAGCEPLTIQQVEALYDPADYDFLYVQQFKVWGYQFVFVWQDKELERQQSLAMNDSEPVLVTALVAKEKLLEQWEQILHQLNQYWYRSTNISQSEAGPRWTFSWKEERQVLKLMEAMEWEEGKALLCSIWTRMAAERKQAVLVKETAARLDKAFARMTEKEETETKQWEQASSHEEILEIIIRRVDYYAKYQVKHVVSDHPEISRIIDYVFSHLNQELTLKGMAQYVSMNEQYLSGLFKKETGESFITYVQRLRIEQAQFYLRETEQSISDICQRVGFAHKNYFLKLFREQTSYSPSEYRLEHRR